MMTSNCVVTVGHGRGFVVKHGRDRIILTAAHCLPLDAKGRLKKLPPPHAASYTSEKTYPKLLGPLGAKKCAVWTDCLFIDPIADIAVLGTPDTQDLAEQAEAYEALVESAKPLAIADAPKMRTERAQLPYGDEWIEAPRKGEGSAQVLSLGGEWLTCTVTRWGRGLSVTDEGLVESGMSGSPIVSMDGKAIGLLSTGGLNPVLRDCLPAWFFRR